MQHSLVQKARVNRLTALAKLAARINNVVSFADIQARCAGRTPQSPAFVSRRTTTDLERMAA
ncbi:MAG: hypothetical protein QNJ44_17700 [Rhodobacter sp.]|nr:hypothetical protein [Rhodobacter sp.]